MRRFITGSLEVFSYVAIVLIVLSFMASGAEYGLVGIVFGMAGGLAVSVVLFGALFLLMDVADNTRRAADALANLSRERDRP